MNSALFLYWSKCKITLCSPLSITKFLKVCSDGVSVLTISLTQIGSKFREVRTSLWKTTIFCDSPAMSPFLSSYCSFGSTLKQKTCFFWGSSPTTIPSKKNKKPVKWKKIDSRTSLVAQWLRICLPVQGTHVRALVREDSTCCGATKPVRHNYWACALEPASRKDWNPRA